jgi:aspartate/methionine/tyrosine aminotransferase
MFITALALLEPGDEVIIPDPGFPAYLAMIESAGAVPIRVSLAESRAWSLDLDAFDRALTARTRLIIVNSPSNPTGGVVPRQDLRHVAQRAREHAAWVMSDEIYSSLMFDGASPAASIISEEGMSDRTIVVDGFSKAFAMTGWRLGYVLAPAELAGRLELLATHLWGSTAEFTQLAGLEALRAGRADTEAMVSAYQIRRDRLVGLLNAVPGMHTQPPAGAFYVFPNIAAFKRPATEIQSRLLEEAGVAVLAGTDFGPGGEGHLRLCFATSLEVIEEAAGKIDRFFRSL